MLNKECEILINIAQSVYIIKIARTRKKAVKVKNPENAKSIKLEYRAVTSFITLEKASPNETFDGLTKGYPDSSLSISTVKQWTHEVRFGRKFIEDEERAGRSVTVTDDITVAKV